VLARGFEQTSQGEHLVLGKKSQSLGVSSKKVRSGFESHKGKRGFSLSCRLWARSKEKEGKVSRSTFVQEGGD